MQEALTLIKQSTIEIGTDREHKEATQFIIDYLREHFKLKVNGKYVDFTFVNRRLIKKDFFAMWVMLEINKVNKLKSLDLFNDILIPLHSSQQNIITFRNGNSTSRKFTTYKGYTDVKLY